MVTPPVGSLVVPSPTYRATMGTGEGAAVLLAVLRGNGKLYYASTDRTYWVPLRQVRPLPDGVLLAESLEAFLSRLLLFLETEECRVDEVEAETMRLALEIPALSRKRLQELGDRLGDRLADFTLEPRSMHALLLDLKLVSLPRAAGAGR
ncbi:MAG: hypothetical protein ACYTEZ_14700 [Planctomycetota bacterium]|jgi:hypothetical protein